MFIRTVELRARLMHPRWQGHQDNPLPSGYAIYRTWFDAREAGIHEDPLTEFLAGEEDILYCWIGASLFRLCRFRAHS